MRIMHIALGGCLSAGPVEYGLTEDTGGHIAYVLGATDALAARSDVTFVDIVTRGFHDPSLGARFGVPEETIDGKRRVLRLFTDNRAYLEKADLVADLPALESTFLDLLSRGERPDVIHAHFSDAAVLARAAQARFGIPWVFSAHSLALQKASGQSETARVERERTAIERADAIVASSRDEAERQVLSYSTDAPGKTHRVAPGVALLPDAGPHLARDLVRPWLRDVSKPIILAIARPVEKKNLATLVEAFGRSEALRERANLVILAGQRSRIGDASSETGRVVTDLFDRADRLHLWGRIALPRAHTAQDVRSLYSLAADGGVFVNPAHFEPFGLTVVEAAQAGVPVVATRHGGPMNILEDIGYGETVDPADPGQIAGACLAILTDPRRRDKARHAQTIARAAYSWRTWASDVAKVYSGLCSAETPVVAPRRLLVSDMDGTLTGDRLAAARLSRRLRRAADIQLVVATGRPITEARRILAAWGLPEPACLIASVGSEIWWRMSDGGYDLDRAYARQIGRGWDADGILSVGRDLGVAPQPVFEQRPWKRSFTGDSATASRLSAALDAAGLPARVIPSHGRFIDVLPADAGKAAAAAHVAMRYGLTSEECLAAGDSGNDRDLLTWAARAVVPANGLEEIADLAHPGLHRARLCYAGGVLEALDLWNEGRDAPVLLAAE